MGLLPSLPESDTYQESNLRYVGKKDTLQFSGREPSGRFPTHPTFPPGPEPPPRKVSTPTFHLSRREPRGRESGNMFFTCVKAGPTSQPPGIRHVSRIQLTWGEERHPSILGPGALRALSNASNFSSWPGASSTKGFHSNVSSFTPRASGPREWKHVLYLRESWAYFLIRHVSRIQLTLRGEERHPSILGPGALRAPSNAVKFPPGPEPPPRKLSTYSKLFFFQVKSLRLFTGNMFVACGEIGTSSWPPRNTTSVTRWGLLWDNGMY